MSAIDYGLVFAVTTFGWGLALLVYRVCALTAGWPMGKWQREQPEAAWWMGAACMALATVFAVWRAFIGYPLSGSVIPLFGVAWGLFWIGFLRVGAQSALLLAPAAALLLLIRWLAGPA